MTIRLEELDAKAVIGISGHAGCGHANSHLGFVQDDSGGLAAVLAILKRATGIDLEIVRVSVKTGLCGWFEIETASGGVARASARRGITPAEARLAKHALGRQAVCTQAIASEAFGRIAGQGSMEVPVAFQTAVANAAIESFAKAFPGKVLLAEEGIPGNCGKILGAKLNVGGVSVALAAVCNATEGGLGPNEDIEGNVSLAGKKPLMEALGLDKLPTFLIEGKVCAKPFSQEIHVPTFLIRACPGDDNTAVARAYLESAVSQCIPAEYRSEMLARSPGSMRALTESFGRKIEALGRAFAQAETSEEKVLLSAELNRFCSEELGGVTFMSDRIHGVMGGVGMIPGTCACLSLFIPEERLSEEVIPVLSSEEAERFADVVLGGVAALVPHLDEANEEVARGIERASVLSKL